MLAPKLDLQRGEAPELIEHHVGDRVALISMTTRMPSRSISSRRSEMPSTRFSRTSSAMRSISVALLT